MQGKAAVLGNEDFVMPFSALGLDTFTVEESDSVKITDTARDIIKQRYCLVVVAENVAADAAVVFDEVADKAIPCVVVVPFMKPSGGIATAALSKALKMATGINILAD